MAQQVQTTLIDDTDGGPADETVSFAMDGRNYEIDLSAGNAEGFRATLAPYVDGGRRVSGGVSRPARRAAPTAQDRAANRAIREWARKRGMQISDRGRIPEDVLEAYRKEA